MGELVVVENVTLDGVMQAPGGAEEDTRGDFRFGGWARPYADHVAAAAGLVDRYILSIHPLTLGAGTRLFGDPAYRGEMSLVGTVTTTTGVIIASYRPAVTALGGRRPPTAAARSR